MIRMHIGLPGSGMSTTYLGLESESVGVYGRNFRFKFDNKGVVMTDFERGYIWAYGSDTVDLSAIKDISEFMKAVGQYIADNEIIGFDGSKPCYSCCTVKQFLIDRGMECLQAAAYCHVAEHFLSNSVEFIRWPSMPLFD